MITKPKVEELLKKATNRYELAVAISKRGRQIINGDVPKIDTNETSEITIASLELDQNKYWIERNTEE